jgi:hypothetical protein
MDYEDKSRTDKTDNVAMMLALIGITIAIIALGWAIKADNRAGDIESQTTSSTQQVQ